MSSRIARFACVSPEQWLRDTGSHADYGDLKLPVRATAGSAGYDFYLPTELVFKPGETRKIPTGIRCRIDDGWALMIFPRSSLGFKYKLQLDNTVGIIDADYYNAENEGHIIIKMTNNSDRELKLKKHDRFAQGIFVPFGITEDDDVIRERTGGFGSTDEREDRK